MRAAGPGSVTMAFATSGMRLFSSQSWVLFSPTRKRIEELIGHAVPDIEALSADQTLLCLNMIVKNESGIVERLVESVSKRVC